MIKPVVVDETGIPIGVSHLIDQLPLAADLKQVDEVVLKFSREFVYLTGLVLLAAWRKSLPESIRVRVDDAQCNEGTQKFLTNTGFREIINTGIEQPSGFAQVGRVPIRPIVAGRATDSCVQEICRIFDEYAGQVKDTQPFRILLSELCENVLIHSDLTTPGYICARVLEKINRCEIAIADTGIGIEQSFERGTNPEALKRIKAGTSALEIALEGLSSSRAKIGKGVLRTHYGFGLYVTRRLVEDNHGTLTIISGKDLLSIAEAQQQKIKTLKRPWAGTFVGITLDLGNPLPLEDVYAEVEGLLIPEAVVNKGTQAISQQSEPEDVRVDLKTYGTQLLTREAGTAIRADIASLLAARKIVVVGLGGIEDITPSFADEAFGKLGEIIGFAELQNRVRFEGGLPMTRRLIEFVLKTRQRPR